MKKKGEKKSKKEQKESRRKAEEKSGSILSSSSHSLLLYLLSNIQTGSSYSFFSAPKKQTRARGVCESVSERESAYEHESARSCGVKSDEVAPFVPNLLALPKTSIGLI